MNEPFLDWLRHHSKQHGSESVVHKGSSLCTTIQGERPGSNDPFWIQLHAGQINFQHLDTPETDALLWTILNAVDSVDLEPSVYVCGDLTPLEEADIEVIILSVIRDYFAAPDLDGLTISTEEM